MKKLALPALSAGVLLVSTGAIFARLAVAPSLAIAAYRLLIASCVLVPLAFIFKRREILQLSRRDFFLTVLSGAFLAVHFGTWITSLSYTSVASSVVLVNTLPVWVGLASFFMGEKISRSTWMALGLSLVGGVLVGYGDFALDPKSLWGDFLALVGGVAVSGYVVIGRKVRQNLSLLPYIALCYGSAAFFLCATSLSAGVQMSGFSDFTWLMFLCIAVFPQLLGHSTYNWALGYFSAGFIAVALLGEPIGSSILAYFLFGEFPTPIMFLGFGFLLSAIVLAARGEKS